MQRAYAKVYLIGAGPGDPELLTLRARRRLAEADLVLYDALVHPEILEHCKEDCERVFVGKRSGQPSIRQARINEAMLEASARGRVVARLKGGDPYLFGRGSEEVEWLAAHGVPFEVVPGVPSPAAVTAYAGISLTHRDLASSVAYLTATESEEKDRSQHDWARLATATQTLVIFMGMRKLRSLMELLQIHGRPADTPVAVVQWASLPAQRTLVGRLDTIAERAEAAGMGLPALVIVGAVVRLRPQLRWFDRQALFGKRVLVARPRGQARETSLLLRERGAEGIELPLLRIESPEDGGAALREAIGQLGSYDALIFTSANGVDAFFGALAESGGDVRRLGAARLFAIGPQSAARLALHSLRADGVPKEYRAEAVLEELRRSYGDELRGKRFLLPRAAVARDFLPKALAAEGAHIDVVPTYRTLGPQPEEVERLKGLLRERALDAILLTSSSTATHLVDALGEDASSLLEGVKLASIGPITTAQAEALGLQVAITARDYTGAGLVEALASLWPLPAEEV